MSVSVLIFFLAGLVCFGAFVARKNRTAGLIIVGIAAGVLACVALKNLRPPHYDAVDMFAKDTAYYEVAGRVMARNVNEAYPNSSIGIISPPTGIEMDDRASAFLVGFLAENERPVNGPLAFVLPASVKARLSEGDLADYPYYMNADMMDDFVRREFQGDCLILALLQLPRDAGDSRLFGRHGAPQWLLMQDQRHLVGELIENGQAALALSVRPDSDIWTLPGPGRRNTQKAFDSRFDLLSSGVQK